MDPVLKQEIIAILGSVNDMTIATVREEIDIDTKFAGRVAQLFVDEGDMVKAGQLVAMMDTGTSKPR